MKKYGWLLIVLLWILTLFDGVATYVFVGETLRLNDGVIIQVYEANPIMAWLMDSIGNWWLAVKIGVHLGLLLVFWKIFKKWDELYLFDKIVAQVGMYFGLLMYFIIDVRHIWLFLMLG